ncbi:permease prefix domain 1-containing protein [Oscillibacter sp.]|uniref:permease prefix domain 1-containing protein n=1 Tax=Oscillibacter sp. TaxID=1945593 RepID=UPI002618FD74|nr:permease prefix domain 1-containing protein [Oscillibacter sp.]MDD3346875.1 permease prefix domain 1-containing protein [Oscillibacter sp.]
MPDNISAYIETACQQIRWKRAQPALMAELRTHLLDQKDAYAADGMDDDAAETEALRQMGDPVTVGSELDRVHRPKPQRGLLLLTGGIAVLGASLRVWLTAGWGSEQLSPVSTAVALLVGFAALSACYLLDFSALGAYAKQIYAGAIGLTVVLCAVSPVINHVSYYARYAGSLFPTVYACWLYSCRMRGWRGMLWAVLGFVPLAMLEMYIPYMTGLLLLMAVGFVLLSVAAGQDWFGIGRGKSVGAVAALGGIALGFFAYLFARGWGRSRIALLLHPEQDPLGGGYWASVIRAALHGAALLGEGSMKDAPFASDGLAFYQLVPESQSDCFLTTIIHGMGWLPFAAVMICFALVMVWMVRKCMEQKNQLGKMIALSVVWSLGIQAVLSILLNLGFVLTSVHFPLLIGNLHLVLDLALIGLALSVFRGEQLPMMNGKKPISFAGRQTPLVSWQDGNLVIALGRKPHS